MASASTAPRDPGTIPLDLAALVYTSRTTEQPKGVMMHGSLVFSVDSIAEYLHMDEGDRILSVLPTAFTCGLSQLLLAARVGATLVIERSFAFASQTLARMRAEDATVFSAVPTVFATILGMRQDTQFPSLRSLTKAAAGLPRRSMKAFAGCSRTRTCIACTVRPSASGSPISSRT